MFVLILWFPRWTSTGAASLQHCSVSKQEAPHESLECPALLRQGPVLYVLLVRLRDRKPELPKLPTLAMEERSYPSFRRLVSEAFKKRLMLGRFVCLLNRIWLSIWASSAVGFRALLHCHVK